MSVYKGYSLINIITLISVFKHHPGFICQILSDRKRNWQAEWEPGLETKTGVSNAGDPSDEWSVSVSQDRV